MRKQLLNKWLPYLLLAIGLVVIFTSWRGVDLDDGVVTAVTQAQFEGRLQLVFGMFLVGLVVFTLRPHFQNLPQPFQFRPAQETTPWYKTYWILGLVGASLILLMAFWVSPKYHFLGWRPPFSRGLSNYTQLSMYLGGITLWVLSFMHLGDPGRIFRRLKESWQHYRREWVLVGLLTLAAFGIRIYRLDSALPIMVSDESAYLVAVRRVMDGLPLNIASDMHRGDLYLGAYMNSLLLQVFGVSLFTGRLMVAIVGALAIPPVYLTARRFFTWQVAWLACLFLLVQPLHVHFSRIALYDIYDPTFALIAMLLIWDGMERGGRWKFALAGSLIGFSQYYYAGARLWLILIPLWFFVMLLRRPRLMASYWSYYLILVASVVLILFPMIAHFTSNNISPLAHATNMSQGEGGELTDAFEIDPYNFIMVKLGRSLRAYVDLGDQTRHFEPWGKNPLNFRWALLVFAVGMVVALRYALHPGILFLLMWFGMMAVFGGAFMQDTPGFSRYVTAMLPMAIFAGMGAMWVINQVRLIAPPATHKSLLLAGVFVMFIICVVNFHYLQDDNPANWMADTRPNRLINDAIGREAAVLARRGYTPYFVLNHNDITTDRWRLIESYQYYCGMNCPFSEITVDDPYLDLSEEWLAGLSSSNGSYIYILPDTGTPFDNSPPSLNSPVYIIRAAYPDAVVDRFNSLEYDTPQQFALFTRIRIPPATEAATGG